MGAATHALRSQCEWQVIALARSALPLLFGSSIALYSGARLVFLSPGILWVRSIAGSISLVCTFFALTVLPPSYVFTLSSTFPIWVALLSWPLYRERPSVQVWVSVCGSVLGILLMGTAGAARGAEASAFPPWLAVLSTLIAAFSTAIAMLGLHRLRHLNPWSIVAHFSGVALAFSLMTFFLGSPSTAPPLRQPPPETWLLLLAVGTTATVGQLFLTKAFSAGPPAKIAVVNLTQVVFALLLDVLFWNRRFDVQTLAGMALVMAPTAWLMLTSAPPSRKP